MRKWWGCVALCVLLWVSSQGFALEIIDCKIQFDRLELNGVVIKQIEVFLGGEGAESGVIGIGSEKRRSDVEEEKATFYHWEVKGQIGQETLLVKVAALDSFGEALIKLDKHSNGEFGRNSA